MSTLIGLENKDVVLKFLKYNVGQRLSDRLMIAM